MKVSKKIQKKMHKLADLNNQAKRLSREIDEYFENKGFEIEVLRNDNGISLDELDYGNDITEEFCNAIENGDWDYCQGLSTRGKVNI